MAPLRFVVEQNRDGCELICRLQARRHFPSMHRIASRVRVTRDEQDSGIIRAVLHMMVGRVGEQGMEVLLIFG